MMTISEDYFDFNSKVQIALLAAHLYQVTIQNIQTGETRILGWFSPQAATTISITKLDLTAMANKYLSSSIVSNNGTGEIAYEWNSTVPIACVNVSVSYINGTLLYSANSTASVGSISYYAANTSLNYILRVNVTTISGSQYLKGKYIIWSKESWVKGIWDIFPTGAGWGWLTTAISIAVIMLIILSFGKERTETATALSVAMVFFFYYISWLHIYMVLGVLGLVVGFMILQKGRKEVE